MRRTCVPESPCKVQRARRDPTLSAFACATIIGPLHRGPWQQHRWRCSTAASVLCPTPDKGSCRLVGKRQLPTRPGHCPGRAFEEKRDTGTPTTFHLLDAAKWCASTWVSVMALYTSPERPCGGTTRALSGEPRGGYLRQLRAVALPLPVRGGVGGSRSWLAREAIQVGLTLEASWSRWRGSCSRASRAGAWS